MKNKKLLYILIPGTLLVWGMIFFRIFNNMKKEENASFQQTVIAVDQNHENISDTFSIRVNYRDPFLKSQKKITDTDGLKQLVKQKVVKAIVTVPWPAIVYSGIIKNQKSNKQLALLQINGQSNMMKIGEEANGVQLLKVFRDSIEVKFLKEKRFISKI